MRGLSLCGVTVERSLAIEKVAGSNLGPLPSNSLGQAAHTHVTSLSPRSIVWYRSMGGDVLSAGKVTAGLAESNGSLPPGGWLKVICGLTAYTLGSALGPTYGNGM